MSHEYDPNDTATTRTSDDRVDHEHREPAKTSAAAAFSLVFGVSALLSALTIILGPLGLVLGIIGIVLGIFGIRYGGTPGVTGRGVAIGGLVLSVLAVLVGGLITIGVSFFLNDQSALDRLEAELGQQLDDLRGQLPEDIDAEIDVE